MRSYYNDLARDMAVLPAERDEDGDPTGPWIDIDYAKSDAAIAEAAQIIEARMAERAAVQS